MTETDKLNQDNEISEETARGFTFFVIGIVFLLSLSLLFFYSTVRARSIGIATGYLKSVEIGYQTGEYKFKNLPSYSFDTGIYKVNVSSSKSSDINQSLIIKVEVQDKFFMATHYSEQLKIIPTLEAESEK